MAKYYIEDVIAPKTRPRLIRHREKAFIERYDFNNKKWVRDDSMMLIYSGEIDTNPITEVEANKIIYEYSNSQSS